MKATKPPTHPQAKAEFVADDLSQLLDRPIAYHRILALAGGGPLEGIMLSQALHWTPRTEDPDGWFWKTQADWWQETALSRKNQETARRNLRTRGLMEEKRQGQQGRIYFRVNLANLAQIIRTIIDNKAVHIEMPDSGNSKRTNGATPSAPTVQITKNTTKTSSKRTTTTERAAPLDVDDSLFNDFVRLGVHPNVARSLIAADRDECERQLAFLPYRPHPHGPVKALVASVKGKWDPPQSYTDHLAAQAAADLNALRMRAQSEEDKKAQGEMELAALERARLDDELDAFYKSLDVEERADIDSRAQRRARAIQPKGTIPRRMLLIERRRVCASLANMPEPEEETNAMP